MEGTSTEIELAVDHEDAEPESFAFIVNLSRLAGANQFALAPGHVLRRASPTEIRIIKRTLAIRNGGPFDALGSWKGAVFSLDYSPWEGDWTKDGDQTRFELLDETEWRYFVVGFSGTNATLANLELAFCLSRAELRVGFYAEQLPNDLPGNYSRWGYHPGRLFQYLRGVEFGPIPTFEFASSDAIQISELVGQIEDCRRHGIEVFRLLSQMLEVEELGPGSPSRFLAYFGILESLLTHRPDAKDPYDSITRQVKKKLALLNNRWTPPLDYSHFGATKPDTVWAKMYAYRSCLAHGDTPDFQVGELGALGSPNSAMDLLKSAVKAVIRLALSEPQLIADLKNC